MNYIQKTIDFEPLPPKMAEFYNTVHLNNPDLERERIKAGTQKANVLALFRTTDNDGYTSAEIIRITGMNRDSVRRAVSDLKSDNMLEWTGEYREGDFGIRNKIWRLLITTGE